MEYMDNYVVPWNKKLDIYQSEDEDSDAGAEDGPDNDPPDPNEINRIPEGDQSEADKEHPTNMEEDTQGDLLAGPDE